MNKKAAITLAGCLMVLGLVTDLRAHDVIGMSCPSGCTITEPGMGSCNLTIDPYYGNVGWILMGDSSTLPDGVTLVAMPPVGFAPDARVNKNIKMIVGAGKNTAGTYSICFNVTQIIPGGGGLDETRICPCSVTLQPR